MISRRGFLTLFASPVAMIYLADDQPKLKPIGTFTPHPSYLGAERWGITGERGPEIVYGPVAPNENTVRIGFVEDGVTTWTWVSPNRPYGGLRKTA